MMETQKKTTLEKRIIAGLSILFVVTLMKGPLKGSLKRLPFLSHHATVKKVQSKEVANLSESFATTIQAHLKKVSDVSEPRSPTPVGSVTTKAYDAQQLRDPLKSLLPAVVSPPPTHPVPDVPIASAPAHAPPPTLQLQGVIWGSGATPKAIINGDVYSVGDTVSGLKILTIDHNGVTVEHEGSSLVYPVASTPKGAGHSMAQDMQNYQWR